MNNLSTNESVYETTIRLIILLLIVGCCLLIIFPFANIILWSLILAMAIHPMHKSLSKKLGGRPKLASFIIVFSIFALIIIPSWLLVRSLVEDVNGLRASYQSGSLSIPRPPDNVKDWPIIGESIYKLWHDISTNLGQFIIKHKEQLIGFGSKMATGILSSASGIIQIMVSLVVAGLLLVVGGVGDTIRKFFRKIGGSRGDEYVELTLKTIGSVVKGILGESLVMALLNGTVFLLAGVPYAGLWTLLAFIFAVLQIPVLVITIPVIIYFFAVKALVPAILWTILLLLVGLSDNFLTPLMLGKGAPVPMLVIFIGVIGGFIAFGFIGLFTGAIIMSVGYKLFTVWLNPEQEVANA